MASKASIPKGTRDFLPQELRQRRRVMQVIRDVYERHGFEPIETPAIENIETLTGKYGEEGDQLLFKILARGAKAETGRCDLGLRYDLTVPLSRFVAMHQHEIGRIFKRYQIQPVYRADRPGHGRFREFYQCDIDAISVPEPLGELSLLHAVSDVFEALGFEAIRIRLNDRRILRALIVSSGIALEQETTAIMAIDKLDKIGREGVLLELSARGISATSSEALLSLIAPSENNAAALSKLRTALSEQAEALHALNIMEEIIEASAAFLGPKMGLILDPALARGLNYYTGAIFEIDAEGLNSSLAGGGRYDHLIGSFAGTDFPAVGISLGFERLCVLLEARGDFGDIVPSLDVLIAFYDAKQALPTCLKFASKLRAWGLSCELYPGYAKLQKQFKYANERAARYVAVFGPEELVSGRVSLKDMQTQSQQVGQLSELCCSDKKLYFES